MSPDDPNVTLIGTVSDPIRTITSPALDPDKTYYWRVDATNTVDSSVSRGFWWNFTTKTAKPVFPNGGQPTDVTVGLNCLATLTATAESGAYNDQGDMTFVWKKIGRYRAEDRGQCPHFVLFPTNDLRKMIPNRYFVEVTNKNGTTKSNEVSLSVLVGVPQFKNTHLDNGNGFASGTGTSRSGDTYTVIGSGDDIWTNQTHLNLLYSGVRGRFADGSRGQLDGQHR